MIVINTSEPTKNIRMYALNKMEEVSQVISKGFFDSLLLLHRKLYGKGPVARMEEIDSWGRQFIPELCNFLDKNFDKNSLDEFFFDLVEKKKSKPDFFQAFVVREILNSLQTKIVEDQFRDGLSEIVVLVLEAARISYQLNHVITEKNLKHLETIQEFQEFQDDQKTPNNFFETNKINDQIKEEKTDKTEVKESSKYFHSNWSIQRIRSEKIVHLEELRDRLENLFNAMENDYYLTIDYHPCPWTMLLYDVSLHLYHSFLH